MRYELQWTDPSQSMQIPKKAIAVKRTISRGNKTYTEFDYYIDLETAEDVYDLSLELDEELIIRTNEDRGMATIEIYNWYRE